MTKFIRVLLLLLLPALCPAQIKVPETPAGKQCSAWLENFDRGDKDAFRAFLEKNYPSRVNDVDREMQFREMTGGFDLKKIEESTATKITALVQERASDQFARLTLEVRPNEPFQITELNLLAIARPAEFSLPHLKQGELLASLRDKLNQDVSSDHFAGAVLLAKDGKPIFAEVYGLADREHKIPNTLKTRFRIGSMNKMLTATATLQLVAAGKIDLNSPLGKYLPDYPNKDVADKVTVHELLTHTGGTGDIFGPEFEQHRLELKTLQDYVNLYGKRPPQFEPGSRWEYSNYGFILLGVIIEKVSGQSYYDYVREHIYNVANMSSTGSEPEDKAVPDRSSGYTKMGGKEWHVNTDTLPYRGTSAGGGYSTVEDLLKFANALEDHKLLDAHYTDLLTTGKVDARGTRYAYGFADQNINGNRCIGHGGGAPGMNGELKICPGVGYVVAVLSNLDPPAASRIADFVTNRLPEH
jgi:D-alanyl-D-alanine carboxypeptidase